MAAAVHVDSFFSSLGVNILDRNSAWPHMLHYNRGLLVASLLALMPSSILAVQSGDQVLRRLAKINVVGSERYTREQVITISGLKEGQPVRLADLGAAADRLSASGLFRSVAYRYAYTGPDVEVTLEVVEDKVRVLVVFDNFIWFKDQDLVEAIRQEVPVFDGTSSLSTAALDAIKRALKAFLQHKNVAGEVEYITQADLYGRGQLEVFSVKGAEFPVCAMEFQGVAAERLSEINDKSKPLLKGQYSRAFTSAFVSGNLIPIYRSKGYLRARFQDSEAAKSGDSKCGNGVTLKLTVEEGSAYTWLKAEWLGNKSMPSGQLDDALHMSAGEVANGLKIDSGLAAVRAVYGKRGYVGLRIAQQPDYDDREHRVAFTITVDEGPQYHMGQLVMTGISDTGAARIKGKWKLHEGDVFDASYFKEFVTKELSGESLGGDKDFNISTRPDRQTLKVDILIAMTGARPK
jgi:outer membrane protein assembly factor BamA